MIKLLFLFFFPLYFWLLNQQKAQDLASIEGIDELHSEEGLNLAETKMKSLNSLWLRFTIERRKFLEAAASMKTKK